MKRAVVGVQPWRARAAMRRLLPPSRLEISSLVQVFLIFSTPEEAANCRLPALAISDIPDRAHRLVELGLGGVKLFAPEPTRSADALGAEAPANLGLEAVRAFKAAAPDLCVMIETCLCSHTTSGACVIVAEDGTLDRINTLKRFSRMAVLQAQAGADVLCPASMMDGTVRCVRDTIDQAGFHSVSVMPHLEFRSNLYNAYRREAGTGSGLHRPGFQIDVGQGVQALAAARSMVAEGADMILVEPGMFFLDVVRQLCDELRLPLGIFSVSGEYVLLNNLDSTDRTDLTLEYFRSAARAGASCITSYAAEAMAKILGGSDGRP